MYHVHLSYFRSKPVVASQCEGDCGIMKVEVHCVSFLFHVIV
jgi:hypothetical protein